MLAAGSLSLVDIVQAQVDRRVWFAFANYGAMLVPFAIFVIAATAETNRTPFDLPEAESELTGGFHTEYSGFRWALYMLAEYANIFVISSVGVVLFLGGWLSPFPNASWLRVPMDYVVPVLAIGLPGIACFPMSRRVPGKIARAGLVAVGGILVLLAIPFARPATNPYLVGLFWFLVKVVVFIYVLIWFRGTWPRLRYDQLMNLGWKLLIPLGLFALGLNAAIGLV